MVSLQMLDSGLQFSKFAAELLTTDAIAHSTITVDTILQHYEVLTCAFLHNHLFYVFVYPAFRDAIYLILFNTAKIRITL